ncbi:MAG: Glycosyl transferase, group 1 [uncultured Sulfurovum sp.]|uniref:Glycosyl transferase, group 1 n=1 Tax=uncultured Sulfurovum sp. TaxID=269237 RepID=A0A6S6TFK4_9BACT|nr:MAG: Glycosyl transferase, group 1 [uncultured Sulfurovum sp.]
MKVLFTCGDRPLMARNKYYRNLLKEKYDYSECVSHGKTYATRLPSIFARLPFMLWKKDMFFVSYMGYFLVIFIRLFSKKPIVFDYYVSLHDMMTGDRKLFSPDSWRGKFTFWLDKRSLELADYIIVDTTPLIEQAVKTYGIDRKKFLRLPVAVNEELIYSTKVARHKEVFTLVYMGSYIPFHGVDKVMEAAKILQDKEVNVHFLMLGKGQTYDENVQRAKELGLNNVEFISYVTMEELNIYYNASDVTLGTFSGSERSKLYITNKGYESFAVGKPHLTLENNALNELFTDNKDIFYIKEPSSQALAERIIEIKENKHLCEEVANNALALYNSTLNNESVTRILEEGILSKFK